MDPESDKKISEHVLRMHRYRNPGEQDGDRKLKGIFHEIIVIIWKSTRT